MPTVPTVSQPSVPIAPAGTPSQNVRGARNDAAFGGNIGRSVESTGRQLSAESDSLSSELQKANQRTRLRKNGVSRAVDFKEYDAGVRTLTTDFKFGDPNNEDNQKSAIKGLEDLKQKILSGHKGDVTSRDLLQIRIEGAESSAKGLISDATLQAGRDAVVRDIQDSFDNTLVPGIKDFLNQTGEMPIFPSVQDMFEEKDFMIEQHENGMTPEEVAKAKDAGDVLIMETLYGSLIDRGDTEGAQSLLDSKLAISILSEERISKLEKNAREATGQELTKLKPGERLFQGDKLIAEGAPVTTTLTPGQKAFQDGEVVASNPAKQIVVAENSSVFSPETSQFLRPVETQQDGGDSDMRGEDGVLNVKTQKFIQESVSQLIGEPVGDVFAVGSKNRDVAIAMEVFMVQKLDAEEVNTVPEAKKLAAKKFASAIKDNKTLPELAREIAEAKPDVQKAAENSRPADKLSVSDAEQGLQKSLLSLKDAGGPVSTFFDAINNTVGLALEGAVSTDVVTARLKKAVLKQKFVTAFLKSSKAPIWEQKIIGDIFGSSSFWEAPEASKAKLEAIDGIVSLSINRDIEILEAGVFKENPKHEQELFSRITAMKDLRDGISEFIPKPKAAGAKEPEGKVTLGEPEVSVIDPPVAIEQVRAGIVTKDQAVSFYQSLDKEALQTMPIEDLRALNKAMFQEDGKKKAQNQQVNKGSEKPQGGALDEEGLNFIIDREGFDPVAVKKTFETPEGEVKEKVSTIGNGITDKIFESITGQKLTPGTKISKESARKMIDVHITRDILPFVDKEFPRLNSNQRAAIASLMVNIGETKFKKSAAFKNLKKGDEEGFLFEAFDSKQGFVKGGGKVIKGLVNRRKLEKELFLKGK